ncbi:MAG: class I SAM-dependent methyltransferase [Elusimicrobiota bacterium]
MTKTISRFPPPAHDFDKYDLYSRAVQNPGTDALFFQKVYRELRERQPRILREDFCGTFQVCCEWVKLDEENAAFGLDLDPEPVAYGRERYLSRLAPEQRRRVRVELKNVLDRDLPMADIVAAENFSYFIFKRRAKLLSYFENCRASLLPGGLLILDAFGGTDNHTEGEEETDHGDFTYYWDQQLFDPITCHTRFAIHLRPKCGPKFENCFTYDWRMWSIPEIRELLAEAGFRHSHVYWEGTAGEKGDGIFTRVRTGEACESWIAYIAAEK